MTALKVTLPAAQKAFIDEQVRLGAFPDASSVVDASLTLLREDEAAKTARFRALIQEALDELDRGEGIEVDDIDAWMNTLGPQPPK